MGRKATPVKDRDQFIVRLPDGMRERLKLEAEQAGVSLNTEIVQRLEASFNAVAADDLANLAQRYGSLKLLARMTQRLFRDMAAGDEEMAHMAETLRNLLDEDDQREAQMEAGKPGGIGTFRTASIAGREAALAGNDGRSSPYAQGTRERAAWDAGFVFAQDEVRKDDEGPKA